MRRVPALIHITNLYGPQRNEKYFTRQELESVAQENLLLNTDFNLLKSQYEPSRNLAAVGHTTLLTGNSVTPATYQRVATTTFRRLFVDSLSPGGVAFYFNKNHLEGVATPVERIARTTPLATSVHTHKPVDSLDLLHRIADQSRTQSLRLSILRQLLGQT